MLSPPNATPATYYKYGPTPSDTTDHWYEFLYDGKTGAEIDENIVTLHFVDGKRGDDNPIADGIVIDEGGLGLPSDDGDSDGACFIAAAGH
ncbi:MAG: choice-of-anchor U domain-containing protein [Thermodesulfobacteriota bacterium]